ncbi:MAG: hypothetical protein M3010_07675 [Candidatus Dormibacteraeota bacterium]|nr:hypothetical protein [Candidatus Dormibacteraeota bacterium]
MLAALAALTLATGPARAGSWMQISCQNLDGSAASSQGWTGFSTGAVSNGSNNDANCAPGHQMTALLSNAAPAPVGASEVLRYTPPPGSTLIGGTLSVGLAADGRGPNASGTAVVYEPAFGYDASNVFFQCAAGLAPCHNNTNVFIGTLNLPANRGGDLYLQGGCGGAAGYSCNAGGSYGVWGGVGVPWAHLLLSSSATPQASAFSGSALQPRTGGIAHLVFTATDSGPGIYAVTAFVDGQPVWSATPNKNDGKCVPVGTDPASGALMFDYQQPCPATEVVDVPVSTSGLSDGGHELAIAVTDAAHNTSTVLDQQISTSNPQVTPVPRRRRSVRAQFVISWSWRAASTRLRSIAVRQLPRGARVTVSCLGRHCPRLKVRSGTGRGVAKLLRSLSGRRLHAGDRLRITVTAPGRRAEHVELSIRDGRIPRARLLKP